MFITSYPCRLRHAVSNEKEPIPGLITPSSLRLTQHWPLIGGQHVELALIDRRPVVLQDATGTPRVCIPRPVGIAHAMRVQEGHQGTLPHTLSVLAHRAPSELPHEHRGNPILLQIGPMLLPDGRERVSKHSRVGALEPLPGQDIRPIVMRRNPQLVRPPTPPRHLPAPSP